MGAVAVLRCRCVNEQRLPLGVHPPNLGEGWMKCEEGAELCPCCRILGEIAADGSKAWVPCRSDYRKSVGRPSLYDEYEPTLGDGLGQGQAGRSQARKGRNRGSGDNEGPAREHGHLLTNSGLTSRSASPSAGLSARAMAVRVEALSEPGKSSSARALASIVLPPRSARRCATSTRRTSASGPAQLAATSSQPAGDPGCHVGWPSCRRRFA